MGKKLYRSNEDKRIAGVCGGLAEYFNIDSTIIRIIWAFFFLCAGSGLILYIAAALIMPNKPDSEF